MDISNEAAVILDIIVLIIFLINALISAVFISGISHVYSMVSKQDHFAFKKVFSKVSIVLVVLTVIWFIVSAVVSNI